MPNVSFGNHFDEFVNGLLESGRYDTVSEVVRSGLRLLEEKESQNSITPFLREIQRGIDSGDAGPLDMSEIKKKARARLLNQNS